MMFWLSNDTKPWFQPRRFGLGAGEPITWQAWTVIGLHVALVAGLTVLLTDRPMALLAAVIPVALLPLPIYAARTDGDWRWRWGVSK